MRQYEQVIPNVLPRTSSTGGKIVVSGNFLRSTSSSLDSVEDFHHRAIVRRPSNSTTTAFSFLSRGRSGVSALLRSLLSVFTFPTILPRWLGVPNQLAVTPSLGRKVTGTLFGHRRGHVSFAVQYDPRSEPVLLAELAVSTSALVKEMSSGMVRIALECEKIHQPRGGVGGRAAAVRLFGEPTWTMYCNGRKCGYAATRACTESDWHVLRTVQSVSVGAGVIPVVDDGGKSSAAEGELLYMRARFERVVGSRDSEAFYMLNPDGNGGPELSIFLLRV
ncbi:hypothetical protein ABFS82_10G162600 [Erythranthe guttata]